MSKSRLDQTMGDAGKEAPPIGDDGANEPTAPQGQWSTTVDIPIEDLPIPWLGLQQGLSKAVVAQDSKVKMGDWLIEGYDPVQVVQFVPLMFGKSRNYMTQDPDNPAELLQHCYSPVGMEHGIAVTELGPGMPCADCTLRTWTPTDRVKNGRKVNDPPLCKVSYDFQGYSLTHETLCRVGFRSTSEQVGQKLALLGKNKGLGQFIVELSSERATTNKFTYAKAKMTIIEPDPEVLEAARNLLALTTG